MNQADVTLGGTGASIPALANLASSSGSFSVVNGATFTTAGDLSNTGTVTIGPASMLTVDGNYSQGSAGSLDFQLGGTPASGQFGQLVTTGASTLDGTLQAEIVSTYQPSVGDQFTVVRDPSENGNFPTLNLPSSPAVNFQAAVDTSDVVLSAAETKSDLTTSSIDSIAPTIAGGRTECIRYVDRDRQREAPHRFPPGPTRCSYPPRRPCRARRCSWARAPHRRGCAWRPVPGDVDRALAGAVAGQLLRDRRGRQRRPGTQHQPVRYRARLEEYAANEHKSTYCRRQRVRHDQQRPDRVFPGQRLTRPGCRLDAQYANADEAALETRLDGIPDLANFDQNVSDLNDLRPQLTFSGNPGGAYFIFLDGLAGAGQGQPFSLTATPASLRSQSVGLSQGANSGDVTIPLIGSDFLRGLQATLVGSNKPANSAKSVLVASSTQAFATFDLTGVPVATYDVQASQAGTTSTLHQAFHVVVGPAGQLEARIVGPSASRVGTDYTALVEYTNIGDTDLTDPLILVTSPTGDMMELQDNNFQGGCGCSTETMSFQPEVQVLAISSDGEPGVLRPGESGSDSILVQTLSGNNQLAASVGTDEDQQTMDYASLEQSLSQTPPNADFTTAFNQITAQAGPTVGDYIDLLSQAANLVFQRSGQRTPDPGENLAYLINDTITNVQTNLSGHVFLGNTSHPLGNVLVQAVDPATGITAEASSTLDGLLRFTDLPPGQYFLSFMNYLPFDEGPEVVPAGAPC